MKRCVYTVITVEKMDEEVYSRKIEIKRKPNRVSFRSSPFSFRLSFSDETVTKASSLKVLEFK